MFLYSICMEFVGKYSCIDIVVAFYLVVSFKMIYYLLKSSKKWQFLKWFSLGTGKPFL